jgi:hypothetical protein
MRRLASVLLGLLVISVACAHAPQSAPTVLRSETVQEDKSQLAYELTYEPKGPRQVEVVLKMNVIGLVETNKLVAETYVRFFNIEAGQARWEGFVPPRQPQTMRVLLSLHDGVESASATVMLSRSHDSLPLLREELTFVVDDKGVVRKE